MSSAYFDAGQVRWHQRDRDPDIILVADQVIGVAQLESQAKHRRDRSESDIALVPVEPDAEHVATSEIAAHNHAGIDHSRGVRASFWTGEPEARNLAPVCKPR